MGGNRLDLERQQGGCGHNLAKMMMPWTKVERKGTDPSDVWDSGFGSLAGCGMKWRVEDGLSSWN